MNKNEALIKVREIIDDLMADSDPSDQNFISNLRMFYQIAYDGDTDKLKSMLVESFAKYYGHTMFSETPIDVLTNPFFDAQLNIKLAERRNKDKHLN